MRDITIPSHRADKIHNEDTLSQSYQNIHWGYPRRELIRNIMCETRFAPTTTILAQKITILTLDQLYPHRLALARTMPGWPTELTTRIKWSRDHRTRLAPCRTVPAPRITFLALSHRLHLGYWIVLYFQQQPYSHLIGLFSHRIWLFLH